MIPTKAEIQEARKLMGVYYKWLKLAEAEQEKGYTNPYLGFQFTGDGKKLARYRRLTNLSLIKLTKMGYEYNEGSGFRFCGND